MTETLRPPAPATHARPGRIALAVDALVIIAAAAAAVSWYWHIRSWYTAPGFPLDDTWIHLQFARNIAEGQGFSFNAGIPSSGSTAPLWTILLAVPLALGLDPITAGISLGLLFYGITAIAAAALARHVTGSRGAGVLTGVAVAIAPRFTWAGLSGMEVPLYAALVTTALLSYVRAISRPGSTAVTWGLLAALAGWARPETFLVVPVLVCHWFWAGARDRGRLRRGWWKPVAACAIAMLGFVALNLHTGGRVLPNTFYAKTYGMGTTLSLVEGRPWDAIKDAAWYPMQFLDEMVRWQAMQHLWLFAGALAGLLWFSGALGTAPPGGRVIVAVLLVTPLVKGLVAPEPGIMVHDGRYIAHLLVLGIVTCAAGFEALRRMTRWRWLVPVLAVGALLQLAGANEKGASTYAREVRNINDLQLVTAAWIDAHTSRDARIATNDIGALAFFTRRFIIDTEGLVTPEAIWPKRRRRLAQFLQTQKPDVLVIFPEWYPELSARTDLLTEIHRVSAERVIAGGRSLIIYRMPWTRPDALRQP